MKLFALISCGVFSHALNIDDGYIPVPNVEALPNDPGLMTGYRLVDAAGSDDAVCLDGSPGLYYHRPGTGTGVNKWYIHQEGGGWCSSLAACWERSMTDLGSSVNYTSTISQTGGYFSLDPTINPLMYNWNMVYFKYCDGGSFSGSNSSTSIYQNTTLHFRGKHILNAGITDMLENRGLDSATDVVVSGCSAGGLATFLHCDHFTERIHTHNKSKNQSTTETHESQAKVVCMPDSGLFLDYQGCDDPDLCNAPHYHDRMTWVFANMNTSSGVNDDCVANEVPTSNCFFAEHTMKYIKTPTFPLQSEYDEWQLRADLGIENNSNPSSFQFINDYGANLTALVHSNLLNQPQHSIFLDSCVHHCGGWGSYHVGPDNITQPFAMKEWYESLPSIAERPQEKSDGTDKITEQKIWVQGQTYPCPSCCQ